MDVFDGTQENRTERLEQYFIVNHVTDDKKVPASRSLIGPAEPANRTSVDSVAILRDHPPPKPLVMAERSGFHQRDQREGQSVNGCAAERRRLPEHCECGSD